MKELETGDALAGPGSPAEDVRPPRQNAAEPVIEGLDSTFHQHDVSPRTPPTPNSAERYQLRLSLWKGRPRVEIVTQGTGCLCTGLPLCTICSFASGGGQSHAGFANIACFNGLPTAPSPGRATLPGLPDRCTTGRRAPRPSLSRYRSAARRGRHP